MVSALICSGQLSLPGNPMCPAEPCKRKEWSDWRRFLGNPRVRVSRMSLPLVMETSSSVSCPRHHRVVEPLLHDSPVRCLLWTCCAIAVASSRTWQCLVASLYPPLAEARLYRQVRLWADGVHQCNLVLATVQGAKESWAVVTDEAPSLQTLWQCHCAFESKNCFSI
jgi:hypothetical protein